MKNFVGEYAMELSFAAIGLWFVFIVLFLTILSPTPNDIPKKSEQYAIELVEQYPKYDNVPQEKLREWYDIATKEKENKEAFNGGLFFGGTALLFACMIGLFGYKVHYDENN